MGQVEGGHVERERKRKNTSCHRLFPAIRSIPHKAPCRRVLVVYLYLYFDVQGFVSGGTLSPLPFALLHESSVQPRVFLNQRSPRTTSSHDTHIQASDILPNAASVLVVDGVTSCCCIASQLFPFQIQAQSRPARLRVGGCCLFLSAGGVPGPRRC